MPWGRLLFAGLLLAIVGFAIPDSGSTGEQISEVRALRDDGGVETTGTVVELREAQRTRSVGSRRTRRMENYTVNCPVYEYKVARQKYTYLESSYCEEVAVGDTEELIYDPAAPGRALNNDDDHMADEAKGVEKASTVDVWMKLAGVILVVGSLVGLVLARRKRA